METQALVGGLSAAASVAAMLAALFSYLAVRHARRSHQSSVYLTMAQRYDSEEMRGACNTLLGWWREHGEDAAAEDWARLRAEGDPRALEVNTARRIVARHFLNIARLQETGAIDRHLARRLARVYGLSVFYRIAAPLNRKIANDVKDFENLTGRLRQLQPSYARGELIQTF
jgi:hypothetical protein